MFIMQAPYPTIQTSSYLPNPQLADSVNQTGSMSMQRSINGTKYTYVTNRGRDRLLFRFLLSKAKALEVFEFYSSYASSQIKITDHLGKVYIGYITSNPVEFEATRRSAASPGDETEVQVQFEFEGELQ